MAKRPDLSLDQLNHVRGLMNRAVLDCLVEGYRPLMEGLTLPDPGDRHVLAAAIQSRCDAIVTLNLKDFPAAYLARFEIEPIHPDDFLFSQFGLDEAAVIIAVQRIRTRLQKPPRSASEYLDSLEALGLPKTVAELRQYAAVI